METAINSKTKKIVSALSLEVGNTSYQFPHEEEWFADPNDILSYNQEKITDINKIICKYRKGCPSVMNKFGTEYSIAPCFFIPNKEELGINTIPESKEHKLVKNWFYNRIINKKVIFKYANVYKPQEYKLQINLNELDIDWDRVCIEGIVKNNKTQIADILIPFNRFHEYFGSGIVIEIQFSKQYEVTTEKRQTDWALKGFSVCWLWFDDFEKISEDIVELKEDIISLEPYGKILYNFKDKQIKDIRLVVQDLSRKVDEKMAELNYPFCIGECKNCCKGYMTKQKTKSGWRFYKCSVQCGHMIWLEKNDTN
jgi:hypothetical protein